MLRHSSFFILIFFSLITPAFSQEHILWTQVLAKHVEKGMVDYSQICKDPDFQQYLKQLSNTDPKVVPNRDSQMAFWINAYNAFTVKLICDHYPIKSINDLHAGGLIVGSVIKQTAWDRKIVEIQGEMLSLGHIEHKILRSEFNDFRIHFAIVCAAKGCPPLRAEAYEAATLNEQLNAQGKSFLAESDKNRFDLNGRIANLSPIFSWFKKDFGTAANQVLISLLPFLPENVSTDIKVNVKKWRIRYTEYDWALNRQE